MTEGESWPFLSFIRAEYKTDLVNEAGKSLHNATGSLDKRQYTLNTGSAVGGIIMRSGTLLY